MPSVKPCLSPQLRRQSLWLRDSWLWLLRTKVLPYQGSGPGRMSALDVGCGPGFVMEELRDLLDVRGLDIDRDMVGACTARGVDVVEGDAMDLPFEDGAFDVAYCSFLLLWVKDPKRVVAEMRRVARRWVICLAEPDFGGRIDHPEGVGGLTQLVIQGIRADGGDPMVGRKLRGIFHGCGMEAEVGVHAGVWDITRLRHETEDEWRWIRMTVGAEGEGSLASMRTAWDRALDEGTLFQYNPIFYALAKV